MLKKYLIIFLVSMVPLIELRGAVPIAVGNMLPVPFIFFFARKVLEWGADKPVIGKFFTFCLEKGHKGGQKLQEKAGRGLFVALLLFVGIPLPGTGAWTGTLAASLLDMDCCSGRCDHGTAQHGSVRGTWDYFLRKRRCCSYGKHRRDLYRFCKSI